MKIAFFLDIPNGLGGAGNLLIQQAGLMHRLYEVIVIIPCDENGNANQEYIRRCSGKGLAYKILYYETFYNFYSIDYLNAVKCSKTIKDFAIREKIDFFHSVQLNIAAEMVARELKIPHLMNIYQLQKDEFSLAGVDIYPHYHLCDSNLYANRWSSMLNITSKCIRPVAPLNYIEKKHYSKKQYYKIVMLGSVCERKNQLTAIKAIELCFSQYDIILEIAGSEAVGYANRCKRYVEQHGLGNKVYFRKFINDVSELLRECDCLLCASTDESFPTSIVEAVTYDLTIISTPVAGVPELFKNQCNAYISNGFDEEAIACAIMNCMKDYENGNIATIHINAHQTWKECFAPDAVQRQIKQYYDEIIDNTQFGAMSVYELLPVEEMKDLYMSLSQVFHNMDAIRKKVFYYTHLRKKLGGGNAYIWGAGNLGSLAYQLIRVLEPGIRIIAFVDSYKSGEYCGKQIIHPDKIEYAKADYFFISFGEGREKVIQLLNGKGIVYNAQAFLLP